MPINFNNATLLGLSYENIFLGDGISRRGSRKNLSIEGIFDARAGVTSGNNDSQGVKEVYSGIRLFTSGATDFDDIILNGVNFGKGRVINLTFNEENPVRIGSYAAEIEVHESGANELFNISGPENNGLKEALLLSGHLLESVSESFSFTVEENNNYGYTHSVDVQYVSGIISDPILSAKNFANILFSAQPALGFIDSQYSGFYTGSGSTTFEESYNLISYECNFTKNFSILGGNSGTYSLDLSHRIDVGEDGIVSISENGSVISSQEPFFTNSLNGAAQQINESFHRCSGIVNSYSSFFTDPIKNIPMEISKDINSGAHSVEYTVSYTNSPAVLDSFSFEHNRNLSVDENGTVTVSEEGTISSRDPKGTGFVNSAPSFLASATANSLARCSGLYNEYVSGQNAKSGYLSLVDSSVNYERFGKIISYSKNFSDDPAFVESGSAADIAGFKKIVLTKTDNLPVSIHSSHLIPNFKEIVHDAGQTSEGSRSINIEAQRKRETGIAANMITNPPNVSGEIVFLINKAKEEMKNTFVDLKMPINDLYVSSLSYNFSSENIINVDLSVSYTAERGFSDFGYKL